MKPLLHPIPGTLSFLFPFPFLSRHVCAMYAPDARHLRIACRPQKGHREERRMVAGRLQRRLDAAWTGPKSDLQAASGAAACTAFDKAIEEILNFFTQGTCNFQNLL